MPIKDYSSYKNTWLAEKEAKKNVVPEILGPPGPPQDYQPPRSLFSVPFSVLDMPGEQPIYTAPAGLSAPAPSISAPKQENPLLRAFRAVMGNRMPAVADVPEIPVEQIPALPSPVAKFLDTFGQASADLAWQKANPISDEERLLRMGNLAAQPGEQPGIGNIGRVISRAANEAAFLPGTQDIPAPSTGVPWLDTAGRFVGTGLGFAAPAGAGGAAITGAGNIMKTPAALRIAQKLAEKAAPVTENIVSRVPERVAPLAERFLEGAAERGFRGATAGAIYGGERGLAEGQTVADIPKAMAEDAAYFALGDVILGGAFQAASPYMNRAWLRLKGYREVGSPYGLNTGIYLKGYGTDKAKKEFIVEPLSQGNAAARLGFVTRFADKQPELAQVLVPGGQEGANVIRAASGEAVKLPWKPRWERPVEELTGRAAAQRVNERLAQGEPAEVAPTPEQAGRVAQPGVQPGQSVVAVTPSEQPLPETGAGSPSVRSASGVSVTIKEPWEMTRQEFENEAYFQGVSKNRHPNIPSSGYWSMKPGVASLYAGKEGKGGKIIVKYASEFKPEVYQHPETGDLISPQEYRKMKDVLGIAEVNTGVMEGPVRATIPENVTDPHRHLVEQALSEGKTVSAEVLKDYPEMAAVDGRSQKATAAMDDAEAIRRAYDTLQQRYMEKYGLAERQDQAILAKEVADEWGRQRGLKPLQARMKFREAVSRLMEQGKPEDIIFGNVRETGNSLGRIKAGNSDFQLGTVHVRPNMEERASTTEKDIRLGEAIWRSKEGDQPIAVTGDMGVGPDGRRYVSVSGSKTGVPLDEIKHTAGKETDLDLLSIDHIREIPAEVNLPNKEYGVELFNAGRELMSPVRYAKLRRDVFGSFSPTEGKIKVNTVENTATIAHEVGHAFDYRMGGNKFPGTIAGRFPGYQHGEKPVLFERKLRGELKEVSNFLRPVEGGPAKFSSYRNGHKELMADFYSLYFLDPDLARRMAPTVTAAFESELKGKPELAQLVSELHQARSKVKGGLPQVEAIRPVGEPRTPLPDDITSPTEATKALVKNTDRIYRYQVQEAAKRAEEWGKGLKEEQLEDIGAAVEKIGNLRTGKSYDQIIQDMTPEQQKVMNRYRYEQERARENVNKFLLETGEKEYIKYIEDYVAHFYAGPPKKKNDFITRWARNSPNAKARKLPTLQEAVDSGLAPLTQNVALLHKKWAAINWKVAVNRRFVHELKNIVNEEGLPVIMKPANAPRDWPVVDHPAIQQTYAKKHPDGKVELWHGGAAIDPEVYKIVRQVLDRPFSGNVVKAIEAFNAYAKKMSLSLSFFHHFALTESAQAALARIWNPLRSLVLVGGKGETIGGPVSLTYKAGLRLMEDPSFRRDAVLHGLTVEAVADVQAGRVERGLESLEAKTRKIFGMNFLTRKLRQVNQWWDRSLWTHYYTGLKSYAYYDLVKEALAKMPETAGRAEMRQVKEKVAELVNDMFGGQEWASKFWLTPQARQALHIALLAPDWTLTNIQVFGKAFTQARNPVARKILWRYWVNMLLAFGAGVNGVNYALNGKWSWENEPGHEWDIDVTNIMRILPGHDPEDKQRYYIKIGKQFREVLRYFTDPIEIIGAKFSPAVHIILEQFTGHQAGSGWEMPWSRENMDFYESIPERLKAVADKFVPFSARGNNFAFTFPMSKGMTPWKAQRAYEDLIKAQVDPNLYQRIIPHEDALSLRKRLDDAARENGLDPAKMFQQAMSKARGDYYSKLWEAVEKKDYSGADQAARSLLQMGVTSEELKESAKRRGLTVQDFSEARSAFLRSRASAQKVPALRKKVQ